jgi:hypothetical protein
MVLQVFFRNTTTNRLRSRTASPEPTPRPAPHIPSVTTHIFFSARIHPFQLQLSCPPTPVVFHKTIPKPVENKRPPPPKFPTLPPHPPPCACATDVERRSLRSIAEQCHPRSARHVSHHAFARYLVVMAGFGGVFCICKTPSNMSNCSHLTTVLFRSSSSAFPSPTPPLLFVYHM